MILKALKPDLLLKKDFIKKDTNVNMKSYEGK